MNATIVDPTGQIYRAFAQLKELFPWTHLNCVPNVSALSVGQGSAKPTVVLVTQASLLQHEVSELEKQISNGVKIVVFGLPVEKEIVGSIPFPKIEANSETLIQSSLKILAPGLRRRLALPLASPVTAQKPNSTPAIRPKAVGIGMPEAVLIGVSTGGPSALGVVFSALPSEFDLPIVVVQHIPVNFAETMATNLSLKSKLPIEVVRDGTVLQNGRIYIAPGGYHITMHRPMGEAILRLNQDPPVNSCRPSVDVLFNSAAQVGGHFLTVILTGMGADGCDGAIALKKLGATVIAQNEETSIVWGMPKAVVDAGIADAVLPISEIAGAIVAYRWGKK